MKVKLTKTIIQGRHGTLGIGKDEIGNIDVQKVVKVNRKKGREPVAFLEGNVIEMSDMTGEKYITKNWAVEVK